MWFVNLCWLANPKIANNFNFCTQCTVQCVANSWKHQRQHRIWSSMCVSAFNCLIQNCSIAIAIHISQIMTRAIRIYIFLHYTRSQTHTLRVNVNFITIHITYFIIVCGTYGKSVCIRIWNKRCVCVCKRLRLNCILKCLFQFEMVSSCFVGQLLKMLCGHNTI